MRIIHISDPHLSSLDAVGLRNLRGKRLLGYQSWYRKRRHQYQTDTLRQVTDAVCAESADQVIVSGDLVQIGLESELREARAWLETLGLPGEVLVTPGNHECYHPESWPLVARLYQPYLGIPAGANPSAVYPVLRRAQSVSIIAASTAVPSPWWAATGTLGTEQRTRLNSMLREERSQLRILVLHHPPLPGMTSARKALTDARELAQILDDHPPAITLHGHLHQNQAMTTASGRIFCTAPPSSVRASSPASYRVFEVAPMEDAWQIDMILKSLVGGTITSVEEIRWKVPRTHAAPLFDPGKGDEARTQ